MRFAKGKVLIAMAALWSLTSIAQSSKPQDFPQSDKEAREAIVSALNAMGGGQEWSEIQDATVSGTCQNLPADSEGVGSAESFTWTSAGREFRYEDNRPQGETIMLSGHGKPHMFQAQGSEALTYETADLEKPFYLPGLVLQSESGDKYRSQLIGRESLDGTEAIHVLIQHYSYHNPDTGTDQDWWFAPSTYLPLQVVFSLPGQAVQSYVRVTYAFSNWKSEKGLIYPEETTVSSNDLGIAHACAISAINVNTQPAQGLFDAR